MLMFAGFLTMVVLVAVVLIFVMTLQVDSTVSEQAENKLNCWDDALKAVRKMRALAACCSMGRKAQK